MRLGELSKRTGISVDRLRRLADDGVIETRCVRAEGRKHAHRRIVESQLPAILARLVEAGHLDEAKLTALAS